MTSNAAPASPGIAARILSSPVCAWLFAVYPVIFMASHNPGQVTVRGVLVACAVALAGASAVAGLSRLLLGSWSRAALATLAWLAVFFAYGPVHAPLEESIVRALERDAATLVPLENLHPLLSLAAVALGFSAMRAIQALRPSHVAAAVRFANVAGIVLMAVVAARLPLTIAGTAGREPGPAAAAAPGAAGSRPDIYYVILDGYARADVLARHYGYDNGPFIAALRERGFQVNVDSWANYNWTVLSLTSSLNYDYLEPVLGEAVQAQNVNVAPAYQFIRRNAAARFLQQRGYRIVHLPSTWGGTRNNPYADLEIPCHEGVFGDDLHRALADISWLRVLQSRAAADLAKCHLANFGSLEGMAGVRGPKFVLAHFILPHHPYLFDEQGRVLRNANLSNQFEFQKRLWERKDLYLGQLRYLNGRVLAAVDRIVAESKTPPIIILQSDHGPGIQQGLELPEILRVRFANFAAYRLPGAPAGLMPPDGTPVNQFRRVFDFYFDARLPILPERQFAAPYRRPFALQEVVGLKEGNARLVSGQVPAARAAR